MGQDDIIKVLSKTNKYLTCKEIAKISKVNPNNISLSLLKMRKAKEVKFKDRIFYNKNKIGRKRYVSFEYQLN